MTTCVLSFSETTKNRNSLKTMSYTETKFGVSLNYYASVYLCKFHVKHHKNKLITWVAEYLRTGRNCVHIQ